MRRHRKLVDSSVRAGPRHYRRLAVLVSLLFLALVGLGFRLVDLQGRQHVDLFDESEGARQRVVMQPPLRGRILDRNRAVLAGGTFVKTLVADPSQVGTNAPFLAMHLAPVLEMDVRTLTALLQRTRTNSEGRPALVRYVVLRKQVPMETWHRVDQALRDLPTGENQPGLSRSERDRRRRLKTRLASAVRPAPVDAQRRYYPGGSLAAHVLGCVGLDLDARRRLSSEDLVGVEGIERTMDPVLRGVHGWRAEERVKRGRQVLVEESESVRPRNGLNVVLTIDATLQRIVETELQAAFEKQHPESISCVMVDPSTGEILALANVPTFDPNHLEDAPVDSRRNRLITDVHEPGSTFKVVTVAGALDAGVVRLTDRFDCEGGAFRYRGATLTDLHHFDELSVEAIVAKSSNIGAAKIALRMGEGLLYHSMRRFGMGEPTGIELPGERAGTVHPTNRWSKISIAWIPMGHEVDATPLQMTLAVSAVANRGWLMRPQLVKRLEDDQGRAVETFAPRVRGPAIREEAARQMVTALKTAVQSGTGVKAQLEGYAVAGKTGTAQKVVNGAYVHDRHYSSFIGFFPADAPQLCIGVFVDEPRLGRYGGETAAPVFSAIARQAAAYLGIPPETPPADSPLQSSAVAQRAAANGPPGGGTVPRM